MSSADPDPGLALVEIRSNGFWGVDLSVIITNRPAPCFITVEICGMGRFGEKNFSLLFFTSRFETCVCHLNPFKLEMGALLYMSNKCFHGWQRK